MPIDTRDWYREKKNDYKPPRESWKSYRPPKRKSPLGRIFLIFLIVACVVATAYTGYLLFTHQTNWAVGAIVFTADIGVLLWNVSALRRWSVGAGTVISIFLVIAFLGATACAFGGIEPLSSAKNEVISWFHSAGSQNGATQPPPSQSGGTQPSPKPSPPTATIAKLDSMGVSNFGWPYDFDLRVMLKPTTSALADNTYVVELYEKGHLRDTTTVSWNQPELNVLKTKVVYFPITAAEFDAYFLEDVTHIFSIKVRG